ncbi:MmgE/PrpD family protein [Actinomycetospora sp. TBRC 11914]|uniref:MmgE/PrpD family protein n=1 Tax=Actinomycetospora sp. TBRC 11914 TaxID=2729387 RepID=UPI00145C9DA7|nr:MmgE/PrpD family protein [Actinomycetospora sp. TBRC 11914]NMO93157.1 MmgE/PrpD family protein [Actinomycetospora sp. TBRC 11914]
MSAAPSTAAPDVHSGYVVDDIGRFAAAAVPADIPPAALTALKRNVLDGLGAAIAALEGELITGLRHHVGTVDGHPVATLIGGGRATLTQAMLVNSVLVRYVDQLDTYLTPGGLCHPADNLGAVLAAAESRDASGEEFLTALAVAYELGCRFSAQVPVMALGLNHALQLAISVAAAGGRLLGLDATRIAHAVAAAAVDNVSLSAVHSEPVSMWKGISPAVTAQRAVEAAALAAHGVTGPRGLFEGPNGLHQLFGQTVDLRLDDRDLGVAEHTHLKKYCALIHGQPVIESVLHLAAAHQLRPEQIDHVRLEVFQTAYDIAGGGRFGAKDVVVTKEQADYNLAYLTAAALLDGQVGPEQLREERIRRDDVQALMRRVEARPDDTLTAGYPGTTPVRVHLVLADGRELSREQTDHEGAPTRPLSWDRVVEKFSWLAEPFVDPGLARDIVDAVGGLEGIGVRELTGLLARVSPTPRRSRTRRL